MNNFDREFYVSYIYDEYKSVHGVRPRWMDFDNMSDSELVSMADNLESQIKQEYTLKESNEQLILMAKLHPYGFVTLDQPYFDDETVEDTNIHLDSMRMSAHFFIPEPNLTIGEYCGQI